MRKRNIRVHVYFNEQEYGELFKLCKETGLNKSVVLRHLIASCEVIPTPKIDYASYIRELRQVGNKFNQILISARTALPVISIRRIEKTVFQYKSPLFTDNRCAI